VIATTAMPWTVRSSSVLIDGRARAGPAERDARVSAGSDTVGGIIVLPLVPAGYAAAMRLLFVLVLAAALLAGAGPAQADTKRCRVGYFIPGADMAEPDLTRLRAHNLPRRTDGYAPRCLVAEAIVGRIQDRFERTGSLPATVRIGGAAWSGGRWNCTYGDGGGTCRKRGKPRRRVTMRIG
jgi:hypothetical protein